jgi:hypothetical protein
MKLQFQTVSVTINGDFYQILFHDELDTDDEPYFLIQRQFEFPDGGTCYFESHNESLAGHFKAISAFLSANKLKLSYGNSRQIDVEIKFGGHDVDFHELSSTLEEMIPEIGIEA